MLEVGFLGEEGSGTGPTLEFFRLAASLMSKSTLWSTLNDGSLMPVPGIAANDKNAYDFFKTVGRFTAKAIIDERTVDFRISAIFWKMLIEGTSTMSLYDILEYDQDYG